MAVVLRYTMLCSRQLMGRGRWSNRTRRSATPCGKFYPNVLTCCASTATRGSVDQSEIGNFEQLAHRMWSEQGEYELLHLMNELRVPFIKENLLEGQTSTATLPLKGKTILDVGCGGGILSEPLARLGAHVTGIDASGASIDVAKQHAAMDPSLAHRLRYLVADVVDLADELRTKQNDDSGDVAEQTIRGFDAVVASEVIEHVADVPLFLDGCCRLVKPGGSLVLSTMNKTRLSYLVTIVVAEKLLRLVPNGIHDWEKYVDPVELKQMLFQRDLATTSVRGMFYNPLAKRWSWTTDTGVNYILHARNMSIDFAESTEQK